MGEVRGGETVARMYGMEQESIFNFKNRTNKKKVKSGKTYQVHGLGEVILLKGPCYPKNNVQLNAIFYQTASEIFREIKKKILKLHRTTKKKKKNKNI